MNAREYFDAQLRVAGLLGLATAVALEAGYRLALSNPDVEVDCRDDYLVELCFGWFFRDAEPEPSAGGAR